MQKVVESAKKKCKRSEKSALSAKKCWKVLKVQLVEKETKLQKRA